MSDIWFTSDTHYGHRNIIEYSRRPFADVREHDEALIDAHNARVKPGDRVFHLGDFGMGQRDRLPAVLKQLQGQWFQLWGNHDGDKLFRAAVAERAAWHGDYYRLKVGDLRVVLFHYPIAEWDGCHRGAWHLHGHSHGTHPSPPPLRRLDAGVDVHGYKPVHLDEVRAYMSAPERGPTPHHGRVGGDPGHDL